MKYPEKYPEGFMRAALQAEESNAERKGILLDGVRYYTELIQDTINGIFAADAALAIAALRIYANNLVPETPDNGELADMLVGTIKYKCTTVKVPNLSTFGKK